METITWLIHIKNIFKFNRNIFADNHQWLIREVVYHEIQRILDCWENLWWITYKCNCCWMAKQINFTCKSRFCNTCSKPQSDNRINNLYNRIPRWIWYHHIVLTIPEELRPFFKRHRLALKILSRTAADSIWYFIRTKYHWIPWIVAILHTFWSKLNRNPHVHLLVTHWYYSTKFNTFKQWCSAKFFLPYNWVKSSRTKYLIKNLKDWCYKNLEWNYLKQEIKFLNSFYDYKDKDGNLAFWYWYFSQFRFWFESIIWYIWRYVKRPVIAQSRILDYDGDNVTFVYKDKYENNKKKVLQYSTDKFIWCLIQHIPEKYFHMIYYYWIFANRCKSKFITIINTLYPTKRIYPRIPKTFSTRMGLLNWRNPFLCNCWWFFHKYLFSIPGYRPHYYDDP